MKQRRPSAIVFQVYEMHADDFKNVSPQARDETDCTMKADLEALKLASVPRPLV